MIKYILLALALLAFSLNSQARSAADVPVHRTDTIPRADSSRQAVNEQVYEVVEIEAEFPGGVQAWKQFLEANLNSDLKSLKKAKPALYTVLVQFIVDKEGNISDITALTKHGYGLEKEVIRVIRKSQKWMPAVQNGRKVKAYRKQPVTFAVTP